METQKGSWINTDLPQLTTGLHPDIFMGLSRDLQPTAGQNYLNKGCFIIKCWIAHVVYWRPHWKSKADDGPGAERLLSVWAVYSLDCWLTRSRSSLPNITREGCTTSHRQETVKIQNPKHDSHWMHTAFAASWSQNIVVSQGRWI